jgi:hypothetical protein
MGGVYCCHTLLKPKELYDVDLHSGSVGQTSPFGKLEAH